MNFKKILWAAGCCLAFSYAAVCQQESPPDRYFFSALGSSFHRLQDDAVSPLIYRGSPFVVQLGYEKRKFNTISEFSLNFDLGKLSSRNATELRPMSSQYYQVELQYQLLKRLSGPHRPFQWFIGGMYRWHNSIRLTPQNDTGFISFLIANSIRAAARVQRHQPAFGREVLFYWEGSLPLISHVIRPSYLNLYNYLDPENNWIEERLKDSEFLTLNRVPGLESEFGMTYPIAGGNTLSLIYLWSFHHYSGERRVNVSRSAFMVRAGFKF